MAKMVSWGTRRRRVRQRCPVPNVPSGEGEAAAAMEESFEACWVARVDQRVVKGGEERRGEWVVFRWVVSWVREV